TPRTGRVSAMTTVSTRSAGAAPKVCSRRLAARAVRCHYGSSTTVVVTITVVAATIPIAPVVIVVMVIISITAVADTGHELWRRRGTRAPQVCPNCEVRALDHLTHL